MNYYISHIKTNISGFSLEQILELVCKYLELDYTVVKNARCRKWEIVHAKFIYFRIARDNKPEKKQNEGYSLADIGSIVNYGSHSNVLHGINQTKNDSMVKEKYEFVINKINSNGNN